MSIQLNVDVTKINKDYLVEGKKGKYLTLSLKKNKDGRDQYENDGFIVQIIPKAMRETLEEGTRGPIVGNYREYEDDFTSKPKPKAPEPRKSDIDDDIPF
jgi:hypothetical protein